MAGRGEVRGTAGRIRFLSAAGILFVLVLGTNMPSPLYHVYAARSGFSTAVLTGLVGVYAIAIVAALLMAGPLADVVGARRVVVPSVVLAAVAATVFATVPGPVGLLVARVLQGLAVGSATGALSAALVLTEPHGDQGRAALAASTRTTGGSGLGSALAGALAEYGPVSLRLPFLVELGLLALALLAALRLPDGPRSAERWRPRVPRVPAAARAWFALAGAVSFLAWAVAYVVLALVPSYAGELLGSGNLLVAGVSAGMLLTVAAVVQFACFRTGARRAEITGLGLLVLGLAGLVATSAVPSLVLRWSRSRSRAPDRAWPSWEPPGRRCAPRRPIGVPG